MTLICWSLSYSSSKVLYHSLTLSSCVSFFAQNYHIYLHLPFGVLPFHHIVSSRSVFVPFFSLFLFSCFLRRSLRNFSCSTNSESLHRVQYFHLYYLICTSSISSLPTCFHSQLLFFLSPFCSSPHYASYISLTSFLLTYVYYAFYPLFPYDSLIFWSLHSFLYPHSFLSHILHPSLYLLFLFVF